MENKSNRSHSTKNIRTNVNRIGVNYFAVSEIYSSLTTMSWLRFFLFVLLTYVCLTLLFTFVYALTGFQYFSELNATEFLEKFLLVFLYNAQTLSTAGGVGISPIGIQYNVILTIETMTGMLGMAIITGLLYARFSKPLAEIIYSDNALISPYKDGEALMLRIANGRKNELVGITVNLFVKINDLATAKREVKPLTVERSTLPFLASTWTIVHPIDKESPLFNFNATNDENIQYDISVWINGKDSATGQEVFSSNTYVFNSIINNAKFLPCMNVNDKGQFNVFLNRVSEYEMIN